ncbi:MAG: hypothetical protein ACLRFH_01825 [Opitutales bacterium]
MNNGNLGISQKSSLTSDYIIDQPSNNSTKSIPKFSEQLAKPGQSMSSNLKRSIRKVKYSIGYLFSSKTKRSKKLKECIDGFKGNITDEDIKKVLYSESYSPRIAKALILSDKVDINQKVIILNSGIFKDGLGYGSKSWPDAISFRAVDDFLNSEYCTKEIVAALILCDKVNVRGKRKILMQAYPKGITDEQMEVFLKNKNKNVKARRKVMVALISSETVNVDKKMDILGRVYQKGIDKTTFQKFLKTKSKPLFEALLFSEVVTIDQKVMILNKGFYSIPDDKINQFLANNHCTTKLKIALILSKILSVDRKTEILGQAFLENISDDQVTEFLNSRNCTKEVVDILLNSDKVTEAQKQTIRNWKPSR